MIFLTISVPQEEQHSWGVPEEGGGGLAGPGLENMPLHGQVQLDGSTDIHQAAECTQKGKIPPLSSK